MFDFIKKALSSGIPWATIGFIAAITGGILYGVHIIKANTVLGLQLEQAQEQRLQQLAAIQAIKEQTAKDIQAVVAEREEAQRQAVAVAQQLEDIKNAPAKDDGVVAPVLDRALHGLHRDARTTAKH